MSNIRHLFKQALRIYSPGLSFLSVIIQLTDPQWCSYNDVPRMLTVRKRCAGSRLLKCVRASLHQNSMPKGCCESPTVSQQSENQGLAELSSFLLYTQTRCMSHQRPARPVKDRISDTGPIETASEDLCFRSLMGMISEFHTR